MVSVEETLPYISPTYLRKKPTHDGWTNPVHYYGDGLSYTLQDIETMVRDMRREISILAGAGKLKRIPVEHITGIEQSENNA